jgi:hypothetical protein
MPTDPLRNSLVDSVTTRVLDFHQRRITNAHPSIDDFDYVVRKELRRLQDELTKRLEVGPNTEIHGFGVSGNVYVATNAFPPLIFERPATLTRIMACFNVAPVGADFHADIRLRSTGLTILSSQIVIPDGSTAIVEYNTFGKSTFSKDDILLCDMTQVGASVPGRLLSIFMYFSV